MTREEEIHKAAKEFAFSDKTETSDFFDKMKLWIVRNKTGELIINRKCPYYHKLLESWCGGEPIGYFDNYMFPEVTFENSPQEVELKLVK